MGTQTQIQMVGAEAQVEMVGSEIFAFMLAPPALRTKVLSENSVHKQEGKHTALTETFNANRLSLSRSFRQNHLPILSAVAVGLEILQRTALVS